MKQLLFAGAASLSLVFALPAPAFAASAAECQAMFNNGDVHSEGWLEGDETEAYFNALKTAGMMPAGAGQDRRLTLAIFQPACERGVFQGLQQPYSKPTRGYGGGGW